MNLSNFEERDLPLFLNMERCCLIASSEDSASNVVFDIFFLVRMTIYRNLREDRPQRRDVGTRQFFYFRENAAHIRLKRPIFNDRFGNCLPVAGGAETPF